MQKFRFLSISCWICTLIIIIVNPIFGQDDSSPKFLRYIQKMDSAYQNLEGYTCTFKKQERVRGELLPQETIQFKFLKPFQVYMKWIGNPHKGRELIYRRGWDNGKVVAHPGSFPDITVNLAPDGRLAMRGNRHPVTEAGIGYTIQIISEDYKAAQSHPGDSVKYVDNGIMQIGDEQGHCFEAIMPANQPGRYYAPHVELCINLETFLPNQLKIRDSTGTLIEHYIYLDVNTNPGLGPSDFDPDNPEYNF